MQIFLLLNTCSLTLKKLQDTNSIKEQRYSIILTNTTILKHP